jgi:hypothetical protein
MKGKDFFSRKSKSDFFETPYSMTEQLLINEKFNYNKKILEPAMGHGAILKILRKCTLNTYGNDISTGKSFFKEENKFDYIITNPPFSLWDEFIKKAKTVAIEKFAFLGRLEFLTGLKRFNENIYFDPEYPLTKIYLFVRKVNLSFSEEAYPKLREDGKYPAGMYHYAWFIFEKCNGYEFIKNNIPVLKMINNNPYILRKEQNENKTK